MLYNIENGLVNELKTSIEQMKKFNSPETAYFISHPIEAMASLRAMVRLSALKSGISVIIIDEILSKYTTLMRNANTQKESENLVTSFEIEIASAVRDYKSHVPPCSPFIKQITEYIILNYSKNITLDSLSSKFKINPSYLSRIFKKEIGKGIKDFIEEIRISNACYFLENTDMNISQIAISTGYNDNNYFAKVFKKQKNMSPSEYRIKIKQN